MSDKQIQKARKLIQKQKYNQARKILQPLAFNNQEAAQMLQQLNQIAPPQAQQKGGGGGIFGFLFSFGLTTCLGCGGLFVLLVIGIIVLVGIGLDEQNEAAKEENQGRGDQDNPIAANEPIIFDDFDITLSRLTFPATDEVERMNMFNEDPAAGTDYALLWVDMKCKRSGSEVCRGFSFNIRLVDDEGNEWGEPTLLTLDPDLDSQEAIGGATASGWVGFEFPTEGREIALVKMWSGVVTLYAEPPE